MVKKDILLPKIYGKIGVVFFSLSLLILILTSYLIWAKVTIHLAPSAEQINQEFDFIIKEDVGLTSLEINDIIKGIIKMVEVSQTSSFTATGSKKGESDIVGEVTIINNYSKEQALIASTRLALPANPEKVILRLKSNVAVSAGKKIKVPVYAEDKENFKELKPARLIIPGLWAGLQDKIYAENETTLSAGSNIINFVEQKDLTNAEATLKDQLYRRALTQVNQQLDQQQSLWPKLVSANMEEAKFDTQANAEATQFSGTMKLKAIVVVFDEPALIAKAREKIKAGLPAEKQLVDLDPKSFKYEVLEYNLENKTAKIKVKLLASSVLAQAASLIDKAKLTGLTEEQVQSYFSQFPQIKSVQIKFKPFWLKKTPRLQDKIEIKIGE
ncbi:MAG: hypothetical protein A2729_02805 [Candidatus Buchananbacteria bacterium RIFCSPHIGHO2_01_FULL_39_14]|uniref:Baseplate protein J-like domain-containing protein n=2 Tax=Candidatus Buchananiibacteriota TaxID=1817903 RepID=A0A1G1YTG7_9BACT|nr:MAG: hypothetical protein A2729_02805 [Candidatus Buchananbacteria bacterium RIFCSPHIGHO2_01_FULL_39_14]OGY49443.1 MAG: hypothetical protein A3D39_02810 [Candidatus Buchananbacteria bacterium RIFCSPHIGHO2_02_FULL_39_17]OGY55634.1 MAG: hypothetical protein A2912_05495 [Candidatus Buchananbacteria bacterium RIFCSPLOWO2_01_FULL_40_23b]